MPDTSTLPRWDATALLPLARVARSWPRPTRRSPPTWPGWSPSTTATASTRPSPTSRSAEEIQAFEEVLAATNAVAADLVRLQAYVFSFVSTDSRNDAGQALFSELDRHDATMRQLSARFTAWVAALGPTALASASPLGADHAYALDRAGARAEHQMGPDEESLYAELRVSGSGAWARLHSDVTSQLLATIVRPGRHERAAPDHRGARAGDRPRRRRAPGGLRRRAGGVADRGGAPCAAAMNAIKGEANSVNDRRRWSDPLDASLFANSVDRDTFEAMQQAVVDSLPDFRRFLRAKARLLGYDGGLAWWDLFAPSGAEAGTVSWSRGTEIVRRAFGGYSTGAGRHGRPRLRRAVGRRRARGRASAAAPSACRSSTTGHSCS